MAASRSLLPQIGLTAALIAWGLAPSTLRPGAADALRDDGRNGLDLDRLDAGYYEHLLSAGPLLDAALEPPPPPRFRDGPLALLVEDLREYILRPDLNTIAQGARWSTNALGLRDAPCSIEPEPGTTRVALIGDSIGVGWGVDDGLGFEPRLQRAWDSKAKAAGRGRVEVQNLCVPGLAPGQRREHLERLGWMLRPDLVLVQSTAADIGWDERRLRYLLPVGLAWDAPMYRRVLGSAGLAPGADASEVKQALRPRRVDLVAEVYRTLADDAKAHHVPIGWVLLPRVGRDDSEGERRTLLRLAREAGFDPIVDLSDAFDGLDPETLAIGPDDYHPNALGHALLADRLEAALADWPGAPWARLERPETARTGPGS